MGKFLPFYTYLNDFLKRMSEHRELPIAHIDIDGGRKSGKSDNQGAIFLSKAMTVIDKATGEFIKASAIVVKKQATTVEEVFSEYSKFALQEEISPKILKSKLRWDYANGNYVKFKPWINRNGSCMNKQGSGWASMDGEYIFVVTEETYELSPEDRQDISEAFRSSNPNAKVLFIHICNPWYPNNPYIKFLNKYLPYDKHTLHMQGYQWAVKEVNELADMGIYDTEFKPEKHLFIHTNWRINPLLTQFDINTIKKAKILRPQEADTADYGVPGYGSTSCYGALMENITDAVWEKKDVWLCGGDEGLGTESSGKTSFVFQGMNYNGYFDVYDQYVWDNNVYKKPVDQQAIEIVDFYTRCREEYFAKTGEIIDVLIVRVDKSAIAFIDTLQKECIKRQLDWLDFTNCSKYEIRDRVCIDNYLMSKHRLRIDKERCAELITEMSNAVWDEKSKAKPKRKDKEDHSINGHEYGLEPVMYTGIISSEEMNSYLHLFSKRGKTNIIK